MTKKYNLTMHITPELKVFVGISSRDTWRYEGHWRGSQLEEEAAKHGWHNINHTLVEDNLTKKEALEKRRGLIESSGCIGLNQRTFSKADNTNLKKRPNMKEKQIALMASNANGVKLSLTFDNRYCSKNGYPVVVRVYKDRKWAYVPTGFSMTATDFKHCGGSTLSTLEEKYNIVKDWCVKSVNDGSFSLQGAKNCLKAPKIDNTLCGLIDLKKETVNAYATKSAYDHAKKQILNVFPDGLPVEKINQQTIGDIVNGMKSRGQSDTTINIYLSSIKASINYAIYKGLFDEKNYPFKKNPWECDKISMPKPAKRQDRWIDKSEVRTIWEKFKETGNKWLGLFMFSYFTGGMNLADLMQLRFTKEWITKDTIRYVRRKIAHKKNDTITVPVSSYIKQLLNVMGIVPTEGELVFKFLEGDYDTMKRKVTVLLNRKLNQFGVSMTYSRHSFCMNSHKNNMPASMVEQAMGHSLSGVSSHYIGNWDVDDMREWFEKLI